MASHDLFLGFEQAGERDGAFVTLPLQQLTHTHIIGTTGSGKTTLLVSLATQLIMEGIGVAVIDPAGDISRRILTTLLQVGYFTQQDALSRFIYLDVAQAHRAQRYIPINILAGQYDPYTAASIVIEAYRRVWPTMQDGNWVNIELMTMLAAVVLAYNHLPLLPYLEDFYRVPAFRRSVLSQVHDSRVGQWLELLDVKPHDTKVPAIVETTLKRIMLLSLPPALGYALSQTANLVDADALLAANHSVCLSLNLEDMQSARLLGTLFTRQMETAIKTRGRDGRGKERPYVLIIDEVQNFIAHSGQAIDTMFAEARRAGVFIIAAHQYWKQLYEDTAGGFSQCGIVVIFQQKKENGRLSVEHAGLPIDPTKIERVGIGMQGLRERLVSPAEQIEQYAEQIDKLSVGQAFVRLPGNRVYKLRTLPTDDATDEQALADIQEQYLQRYTTSRTEIEAEIAHIRLTMGSDVPKAPHTVQSEHHTPPIVPAPLSDDSAPRTKRVPPQAPRIPKEKTLPPRKKLEGGEDAGF